MNLHPSTLEFFFNPRSVAVIGASNNPAKLGFCLACNLIDRGYPGAIHLVNPKGGSLRNREVIPSIAAAPGPVDLAVLPIPPRAACSARTA